jgi:hypothetical protein
MHFSKPAFHLFKIAKAIGPGKRIQVFDPDRGDDNPGIEDAARHRAQTGAQPQQSGVGGAQALVELHGFPRPGVPAARAIGPDGLAFIPGGDIRRKARLEIIRDHRRARCNRT